MAIEGLKAGDLEISVDVGGDPGRVTLRWLGKSAIADPRKVLLPFFEKILGDAAAAGRSVEMRFEKLEHFNSSTVQSLIYLIQGARAKRTKLCFVFDEKQRWQKLSFDALRVFAKDELLDLRSI